jgi:hypothetical protein
MAKVFDETPCRIPGGCKMGIIFLWTCNRQYFKKDHNSRIKSVFEIGEKEQTPKGKNSNIGQKPRFL